jgi:hypothetical protein
MTMTKFFDVLWHFLYTRCNGYTPMGRYLEFGSDVSSTSDVEMILQVTAIPIAELLGISSSLALSRRDVRLPCRVSCCCSLINQCRQFTRLRQALDSLSDCVTGSTVTNCYSDPSSWNKKELLAFSTMQISETGYTG